MLDYAANALVYWPVERLKADFYSSVENAGGDPDQILADFLGDGVADHFWDQVSTNLRAGRVRLVFVADHIPHELRRVVEFLNEQMDPAEVIAIEVRQFIGEGIRSLVPNVVGRTEEAQARKAVYTSNPQWTEETFLERVTQTSGKGEAEVARTILNWARQRELRVTWGRGRTEARFIRCWTWSTEASIQQQYAMGSTAFYRCSCL